MIERHHIYQYKKWNGDTLGLYTVMSKSVKNKFLLINAWVHYTRCSSASALDHPLPLSHFPSMFSMAICANHLALQQNVPHLKMAKSTEFILPN